MLEIVAIDQIRGLERECVRQCIVCLEKSRMKLVFKTYILEISIKALF